jgi:hypothetical protein
VERTTSLWLKGALQPAKRQEGRDSARPRHRAGVAATEGDRGAVPSDRSEDPCVRRPVGAVRITPDPGTIKCVPADASAMVVTVEAVGTRTAGNRPFVLLVLPDRSAIPGEG